MARQQPRNRDRQLDAVRAVAVLAMFVAHFAPSGGPGGLLDISEYVAAPLFSFVIGWGAALGADRPGRARSVLVRGGALLVIGWWLVPRIDQIFVVLPWLGVVVLATGVVVRFRSRWVLLVALALLAVEPVLMTRGQDWLLAAQMEEGFRYTTIGLVAPAPDQVVPVAVELLVAGGPYRVTWLLPLALVGVLVQRRAASGKAALVAAQVGWIVSVLMLGAGHADLITLEPYSGRYAVLVLDLALVVAIGITVYWLARWIPWLGSLLAPCGAMALSVYVAQVLASQAWVDAGAATDNSWVLLGLMLVVGLLAPMAWRAVLGGTPLGRGPLEAPLALLSGSRTDRSGGRPSARRTVRAS